MIKFDYEVLLSGIFASFGSVFGKLSGSTGDITSHAVVSLVLSVAFILLMLTCNTCGMVFYVRALHNHTSSLTPTLGAAAVNYICSALAGFLLFGEATSLLWWCGTGCIIAGLAIIFKTSEQIADDGKSD